MKFCGSRSEICHRCDEHNDNCICEWCEDHSRFHNINSPCEACLVIDLNQQLTEAIDGRVVRQAQDRLYKAVQEFKEVE